MEKNYGKELELCKNRSNFVIKALFFVSCLVVAAQFAFFAQTYSSLQTLNNKLNAMEEERNMGIESLRSKKLEDGTRRSKRSIDNTEFNKAMLKLEKLERRLNQSYQYAGRQPAFLLRGPPGVPGSPGKAGKDGTAGSPGKAGKDGMPGSPGKAGKDGTAGSPGKDGRDGRDGEKGSQGKPGVQGERGPSGPQGPMGIQGKSGEDGVTYIRWGKKTCANTGAALVYEGYVGGSHYASKGGASNYVCLTRDPIYAKYQSGYQNERSRIYGAEYQTYSTGIYPSSLYQHDVPCAVCHVTKRASQMMLPGRNVCPAGWTREYKGYLMAESHNSYRTMYTCVDENPDYTRGTNANLNGVLFFFVEGYCGSLPCKPYIGGHELTCAVCSR